MAESSRGHRKECPHYKPQCAETSKKHHAEWEQPDRKSLACKASFPRNVRGATHRDRRQMSGSWGRGGGWGVTAHGDGVSSWGDRKALELERGDGYTSTANVLNATENVT